MFRKEAIIFLHIMSKMFSSSLLSVGSTSGSRSVNGDSVRLRKWCLYLALVETVSRPLSPAACSVFTRSLSLSPPLGLLQVRVVIVDENDCVPEFLQSIYSKDSVPETVTTATSLLQGESSGEKTKG